MSNIRASIKSYMYKQNRPYSAQDVFNNTNKLNGFGFGKTAVTRALDELADNNDIKMKINGKQKLYFADQSQFESISDASLLEMDTKIKQLNDKYNHLRETIKEKESQLNGLKNSESLEALEMKINERRIEMAHCVSKLAAIQCKTKDLDEKQMENLKRKRNELVCEWRKRKRLAIDMLNSIADSENCTKPKKVLIEEIGWETDDDYKVSEPNIIP